MKTLSSLDFLSIDISFEVIHLVLIEISASAFGEFFMVPILEDSRFVWFLRTNPPSATFVLKCHLCHLVARLGAGPPQFPTKAGCGSSAVPNQALRWQKWHYAKNTPSDGIKKTTYRRHEFLSFLSVVTLFLSHRVGPHNQITANHLSPPHPKMPDIHVRLRIVVIPKFKNHHKITKGLLIIFKTSHHSLKSAE